MKNEFGQAKHTGQSNVCRRYVLAQSPEDNSKVEAWRSRY